MLFSAYDTLRLEHRLVTIIDSDRVLAENGNAVEYDHPAALLERKDGIFTSLVNETGPRYGRALRKAAKGHGMPTTVSTTAGASSSIPTLARLTSFKISQKRQ